MKYAQSLIDDFSEVSGMPQIAVSVDMLDIGIDARDSKSRFLQNSSLSYQAPADDWPWNKVV